MYGINSVPLVGLCPKPFWFEYSIVIENVSKEIINLETVIPLVIGIAILLAVVLAVAILRSKHGIRAANNCYGFLLIFFALSIGRNLSTYLVDTDPPYLLFFYPFWLNLSFGPLVFYFLKWSVFPGYAVRLTDSKHAVAPIGQFSFFMLTSFQSTPVKEMLWRFLVTTYYKAIEGTAYLISSISYLVFGYRYLKYREALLRRRPVRWAILKVRLLKHFVRVLFVIGGVNISYVISDFVLYNFMRLSSRGFGFQYWGDLSFSVVLLWIVYFGYRYWFALPANKERLENWDDINDVVQHQYRYLDAQFRTAVWAREAGLSTVELEAFAKANGFSSASEVIAKLRTESVLKRLGNSNYHNFSLSSIFRESGFHSEKIGRRWFAHFNDERPEDLRV